MDLGQPKYLKDKAEKSAFSSRVRLQEGENIHRILFGPLKVQTIYWPTLEEDSETGTLVPRNKMVRRPEQGCIFDNLASLEKRIRAQQGEDKPRSSFAPSNRWWYAVIDKTDDEHEIKIAEYPFTVYQRLIELESQKSTKNTKNLRHGLVFMYDVIITKKVDPGRPKYLGTSYEVDVDPENEFSGKIPGYWLGQSTGELNEEENFDLSNFFNEEELQMIQDSTIDLEKEATPDNPDDILAKLKEYPIHISATQPDGSYRFPEREKFMEQLTEFGLTYLGEGGAQPQLEAAPEKENITEAAPEEEVVNVDDELPEW